MLDSTDGGTRVAHVLKRRGIRHLFTLCGGHISPILVAAKKCGIEVIDTRTEATAVFAADAMARLTGGFGVAAVTAGPGVTNAVTALKNASMAESPVVLLGGATATLLRGRGALQDIDQPSLLASVVKRIERPNTLREVVPALERAFDIARRGVPGPVFVELPIDVLYPEAIVRSWYSSKAGSGDHERSSLRASLHTSLRGLYLRAHLAWLFHELRPLAQLPRPKPRRSPRRTTVDAITPTPPEGLARAHLGLASDLLEGAVRLPEDERPAFRTPDSFELLRAARLIRRARRPLLIVGSQAMLRPSVIPAMVEAIEHLDVPVFLSGMARGLLRPDHPLLFRHHRSQALREADLVTLVGASADFRLDYGRPFARARVIALNRSAVALSLNRRPTVAFLTDPAQGLIALAREAASFPSRTDAGSRTEFLESLRRREDTREHQIRDLALGTPDAIHPVASENQPGSHEVLAGSHARSEVHPIRLLSAIASRLSADATIVADGGDFVATAAYVLSPHRPLSWLDPGPFGTLGVGAGFALAAKLLRPTGDVWLLYGDGAAGFSLMEFDTLVRHNLPVIAVIGNDARWSQIARDQKTLLGDDVGTELQCLRYHKVAEACGARGVFIDRSESVESGLDEALALARAGHPVLVNVVIARTDFRKGSISI